MIERLARKLMTADTMAVVLVLLVLQVFSYGISESLRNTDTTYFLWDCVIAASLSFGLGKIHLKGIRASAGMAALGLIIVWILGARLSRPLLELVKSTSTLFPQLIPALRYGTAIDTTSMVAAWEPIAESSSALFTRLQTWLIGFDKSITINDALIRNMVWIFILWICAAWMGWFTAQRRAVTAFLPILIVLAAVTSYSEYKVETLWMIVMILLVLMGIWNYKNHTQQWEKRRIDFSDSIRFDNGQAVLIFTIAIGSLTFITPSVSWQDIVKYIRERQSSETAEMLGIQEPAASGKPVSVQTPSLPRDHLLTGGFANSEKVVMTVRTGELPPVVNQSLTVNAPRYYWRSIVYDQYVGTGWVTTTVTRQSIPANTPLIPGLLSGYRVVHLDVNMVEPEGRLFWSGILFSTDIPFSANWRIRPPSDLFADQNTLLRADMLAASSSATSYHAETYIPIPSVDALRSASTDYPQEIRDRYLILPRLVPQRVHDLAREITEDITNPYDKTKAIETYLRNNYMYDLNVPAPPEGRDVADYFLFDLQKGYCDYYATSMVVLARSVGIPARFVSGYSPGSYDAPNAEYIVRELNAHSWVEIYFPEIGWIEFEPTASQPEIERTANGLSIPENQGNEETASEMLTRFRLERIFIWASPAIAILLVTMIYFVLIERWYILRLAPETAIDRIYQNFYRAGRLLAGEWVSAETSSEFLHKFMNGITNIGLQSRLKKDIELVLDKAIALTDLYHSTLFIDHHADEKDARSAWDIWIQLRRQIYIARFILFLRHKSIDKNKIADI